MVVEVSQPIINQIVRGLFIIAVSLIFAKILNAILQRYVKKIAQKTKTDIDDKILEIVTKPLYISVILLGVYFALRTSEYFVDYIKYIDDLFFAGFSLLIAMIIARISSLLITRWLKFQKKYQKTPQIISKIVKAVIYLIAILIILSHFGIEITPLVAGLGLGGLAIGLALQTTLSNFFAGIHILSDRPIKVGDFIQLEDGTQGFVEDIGWRSTRIKTLANYVVIIPNNKLAESIIVNFSLPEQETSVIIECGVSYESDLEKVEKIVIDEAKKFQKKFKEYCDESFEPLVRFHTFADSNINFSIIIRAKKPEYRGFLVHELIKAIKKRFDKEKIEINYPVRKILMEK